MTSAHRHVVRCADNVTYAGRSGCGFPSGCGLASGSGSGSAPVPHPQVSRHKPPRNPGRKPGRRNPGPLGSAEERSEAQGKASMSEHMDVRVAQRPALREHRRGPRVHDAHGARTRGGLSLGYFSLAIQREVTRPPGRNAFASEKPAKSEEQRSRAEPAPSAPASAPTQHGGSPCRGRPRPRS